MAATIWTSIKNMFRKKKDEVAEAIDDPINNETYYLQDREKEIKDFERDLLAFKTQINTLIKQKEDAERTKNMYDGYAKDIAAKIKSGNAEKDWPKLLNDAAQEVQKANARLNDLNQQISSNGAQFEKLQQRKRQAQNAIDQRHNQLTSNAARLKSAQLQKKLNEHDLSLSGDGVKPLEEVVRQAEAEADAYSEVTRTTADELADAVGPSSSSEVKNLVSQYLA